MSLTPNQKKQLSSSPVKHDEAPTEALYLQHSNATIEAPNQRVSVFFDECNREIVSLTSQIGAKTKVTFQATDRSDFLELSLPVEKKALSVKLNPSRTVLAYHIEGSVIELINVSITVSANGSRSYSLDDKRYVQSARAKNCKLFGFIWVNSADLVMITDVSVEYYHVDANRQRLRFIKSYPSSTNWFVYHPATSQSINKVGLQNSLSPYSILMVSIGSTSNCLQPYLFTRRSMSRLQRFGVDGDWKGSGRAELFERSISIVSLYGKVRLLVLQHQSLNLKTRGAQILIYTVDCETGFTSRTHTLDLDVDGKFAINILDNLVVAHDQPSKSSFIFDIKIRSTERADCESHYVSLLERQTIKPLKRKDGEGFIEMYSSNWIFFQPNFIIDAKLGMLVTLHIDLKAIQSYIKDDHTILNFLSFRSDSDQYLLERVKGVIDRCYEMMSSDSDRLRSPLADVSSVFELLGRLVEPAILHSGPYSSQKVDRDEHLAWIRQEDVYRVIFRQFEPLHEKVNR